MRLVERLRTPHGGGRWSDDSKLMASAADYIEELERSIASYGQHHEDETASLNARIKGLEAQLAAAIARDIAAEKVRLLKDGRGNAADSDSADSQ